MKSIEYQFPVCVRCMTYNQASFIEDAMNGFTMQQTDFPFVCIVVDDASTDGEPDVIRRYLSSHFDLEDDTITRNEETDDYILIYARHKANLNCFFVVLLLKYNHFKKKDKSPYFKEWTDSVEYIALCEGDDYWTSADKLQKQVDFLESHPDYTMCFHSARIRLQDVDPSMIGARFENLEEKEYSSTEVFSNWFVPTASILYRKDPVSSYSIKHPEWLTRGDIGLVLKCSHTGKIWGMKEQMSVYRMQPNSVSHNPKYRNPERFLLPNHFRCILLNFPKVNREPIKWNISSSYYSRMKCQKSIWKKALDFIRFCYWDPRYASKKIMKQLHIFV